LEASEIEAALGSRGARIHVACDLKLVDGDSGAPAEISSTREPLQVVFVSRLAPKKNLEGVLLALRLVRADVDMRIYGPEDRDKAYVAKCKRLATKMPENVSVTWEGPVEPQQISGIFRSAHVFAFPTYGENFGHVIAESLLAGCPVVTSTKTPWNALGINRCGLNLDPDDHAGLAAAIDSFASIDSASYIEMRANARRYADSQLQIAENVMLHRRMLHEVLAG
jgi:glycosyltransferase involved in cell wall biosynthesis